VSKKEEIQKVIDHIEDRIAELEELSIDNTMQVWENRILKEWLKVYRDDSEADSVQEAIDNLMERIRDTE